ncbi:sulfotransferase domain-containing protein, partial [Salmonella sp. s55004]|uniref:sulfotransferase domain-containing protein n=1 Tax=Salmonella sp. s55004 TaxID=3159675 RepID=UPI00397F98C6
STHNTINMNESKSLSDKQEVWENLRDYAKELSYEHEGHILPTIIAKRYLPIVKNFEVRHDDIFLITFPKSGTTWMQNIITLMMEDGKEPNNTHLFRKVPFLEMPQSMSYKTCDTSPGMYEIAANKKSPRILKTQLPMALLPTQLKEKKPKIIYVARNPKDSAVSYFNFCSLSDNLTTYRNWSDFF